MHFNRNITGLVMKAFPLTSIHDKLVSSTSHKLSLLLVMYLSQRIFLCFSWTLFPIVLRRNGASLSLIGFSALVYCPWALKFIYASLIDRTKGRRLGRRKSWIIPLLGISALAMLFLAFLSPEGNLGLILAVVTLLNFAFSTIDIAVDGYATDILEPKERPWGNTIQTIGYVVGYMLGSGVFLIVYQHAGWQATVLIMTLIQLILMVPIFLHQELPAIYPAKAGIQNQLKADVKPKVWPLLKQKNTLWFFLFAGLLMVMDQGGLQLRLPMLVDIGLDPAGFGRLNIWFGSPLCIVGATLGGALLSKLNNRPVCVLYCLGAACLSLFSAYISQGVSESTWLIAVMIGTEKLMAGIIITFISSIIMNISVGPQSATNYAVLTSMVQLVQLAVMPAAGVICDMIGYFHLYIFLALFGVTTLFIGDYILRKRLMNIDVFNSAIAD